MILEDFVCPDVTSNHNYLLSNISRQYGLPHRCEHHDYIKHIDKVPKETMPEVFGLHCNAGYTANYKISENFFNSLQLIQGKQFIETPSIDIWRQTLAMKTEDILGKLPEKLDCEAIYNKFPCEYLQPLNAIICREAEFLNRLLEKIESSLKCLEKSLCGSIVMTEEIEELAGDLLIGRIPKYWENYLYPTIKKLSAFVLDFVERINYFQSKSCSGIPSTFWISGLCYVQAYLTAVLQRHAREFDVPFCDLTFDFEVLNYIHENNSTTTGAVVYGLFLVGAKWEKDCVNLEEQDLKITSYKMPFIKLIPTLKQNVIKDNRYECPVYITSVRQGLLYTTGHSKNFVLSVLLPTNVSPKHWIKRGVAMLCQLD